MTSFTPVVPSGAYASYSRNQVREAAQMLRFYRTVANSTPSIASRGHARSRLWGLTAQEATHCLRNAIDAAINRKVGSRQRPYPIDHAQAAEVAVTFRRISRSDPNTSIRIDHFTPPMMRALRKALKRHAALTGEDVCNVYEIHQVVREVNLGTDLPALLADMDTWPQSAAA